MCSLDGRFTDQWVVDRTLFDHLSGGSCSCCGLTHQNVGALMQNCSDIETDDGRKERKSPWPPAMSNEVWTARVKLRAVLKEDMPRYKQFWETQRRVFTMWWTRLPTEEKRRTLSMPVEEVPVIFQGKYDLRGAYSVVMCAVNEQLRNFDQTGIQGDGRTSAELSFEKLLKVHRGAYLGNAFLMDEDADQFFEMCTQVGGPRLLPSRRSPEKLADAAPVRKNPEALDRPFSSKEVDGAEINAAETEGQSFRADRRLVRLIIFRYMFDKAIRKYQECVRDLEVGEPAN